jgi:hypothetical protein
MYAQIRRAKRELRAEAEAYGHLLGQYKQQWHDGSAGRRCYSAGCTQHLCMTVIGSGSAGPPAHPGRSPRLARSKRTYLDSSGRAGLPR